MPWNDASETVVAGTGQVYAGPVGTSGPTNESSSLNSNWAGLGYLTEDGVSITSGIEIIEFPAWQAKNPIRREVDTRDFAVTFTLQQWNEETVPFAFGGGAITEVSSGHYKFTPAGDTESLDERALLVELVDGSNQMRIVIPRGTIVDGVESQFARNQMSGLAVTFRALEPETGGDPWHFLSNSDAYAAGS